MHLKIPSHHLPGLLDDKVGRNDANFLAPLKPFHQLLDLVIHLGQARDVILRVRFVRDGMDLGEQSLQFVVVATEEVMHRVVMILTPALSIFLRSRDFGSLSSRTSETKSTCFASKSGS
jgi:hypothetical protein